MPSCARLRFTPTCSCRVRFSSTTRAACARRPARARHAATSRAAAATAQAVAARSPAAGAAAALAPADIANVLLHAVAMAKPGTSSAYDGLLELITSDASGDAVMAPAALAIQADAAAINELATSEAVSLAPFAPLTLADAGETIITPELVALPWPCARC